MQGTGHDRRLTLELVNQISRERVRRQAAGRITRVNARLLDVLHDTADEHAFAIGQAIDIDLDGIIEEPIEQHG